jgi:hypothetical protein
VEIKIFGGDQGEYNWQDYMSVEQTLNLSTIDLLSKGHNIRKFKQDKK